MSYPYMQPYQPLTQGARPTNPNWNQPQIDQQVLEMLAQQKAEQFQQMDNAGVFGGIRNSPRNPGGDQNSGLDWLKQGYNPDNNPFEGRNPQAEAMAAVEAQRQQQQNQRHQEAIQLALTGQLRQNVGGANMASFFNPATRGDAGAAHGINNPLPQADLNVLNVPEQYGGGLAMGRPAAKPINVNEMLPTGGYSPALGVGGSSVPMSAGEAFNTDSLGKGIYAERDRSNPASQDASMARRGRMQREINSEVSNFFSQPPQQIAAQLAQRGVPVEVALDEAVNKGELQPEQAQQIEIAVKSAPAQPARDPAKVRGERRQQQNVNQELRRFGQGKTGLLPHVTADPGILDMLGTLGASAIPYAAKPAEWTADLLFGDNSRQGNQIELGANEMKNSILDWLYANLSR